MKQGSNGQSSESPIELEKIFVGILAGFICAWAVWLAAEPHIKALLGALSWVHLYPVNWLAERFPVLLTLPFVGEWLFFPATKIVPMLERGGYAVMDNETFYLTLVASGRVATIVYSPLMFFFLVFGLTSRPDQYYRQRHTLDSLIKAQSNDWASSRVSVHVNPLDHVELEASTLAKRVSEKVASAPQMPGFALPREHVLFQGAPTNRAMNPEEHLLASGLTFSKGFYEKACASIDADKNESYRFEDAWPTLELSLLEDFYARQLRDEWRGPDNIRPVLRAVLAVLILFFNYRMKESTALLYELGAARGHAAKQFGVMDQVLKSDTKLTAKIDKIIAGKEAEALLKIASKHAYLQTAFARMLIEARKERGVLASASFSWLKHEDRLMWYILNNIGGQAIVSEAAGAIAHLRAEMQFDRPLSRPRTFQAARALLYDYLDAAPDREAKKAAAREARKAISARIAEMSREAEKFAKDEGLPSTVDDGSGKGDDEDDKDGEGV